MKALLILALMTLASCSTLTHPVMQGLGQINNNEQRTVEYREVLVLKQIVGGVCPEKLFDIMAEKFGQPRNDCDYTVGRAMAVTETFTKGWLSDFQGYQVKMGGNSFLVESDESVEVGSMLENTRYTYVKSFSSGFGPIHIFKKAKVTVANN